MPRTKPDNTARSVRQRRAPRRDRRAARSQRALHDAMRELLQQMPFDRITVRDLLERADVSRTTFYAHFQDQGDLLLAGFERMLDFMAGRLAHDPPGQLRIVPVRELCEHFAGAVPRMPSLQDSAQWQALWAIATGHFARAVERGGGDAFAARFLAGALTELLRDWLARNERPAPAAMDLQFHRLARRVLAQ